MSRSSREGKYHLSVFVNPEVSSSLFAIQVKHPKKKKQDIVIEALNAIFRHYDVPETA